MERFDGMVFSGYSVLTSQGSIISLEYDQLMSRHVPEFVDPRIVAHSTFAVGEGQSPPSSGVTSTHSSDSRSLTRGVTQFPFLEERLPTDSHTPHHQFNYLSFGTDHTLANSFAQCYQGTTATGGNNSNYFPRPQSYPSSTHPSTINAEMNTRSPLVHRRGPGRPRKAPNSALFPTNKRPTGHAAVKLRRQLHNDSAMRSRARFHEALEELWNVVPALDKAVQSENGIDDNREVSRAVKVEVAINYLKKLQVQLSVSRIE